MSSTSTPDNPIFLSLCGIPGSGKSTLSVKLAEELGAKLYCCDDFFSTNKRVEEFHADICADLTVGNNVVCDGTYTFVRTRRELLDGIASVRCRKVIVILTTPFEECLRRNANRERKVPEWCIKHMHETFQHPTTSEGWDEVIYMNSDWKEEISKWTINSMS